jgi:hypothetical protein
MPKPRPLGGRGRRSRQAERARALPRGWVPARTGRGRALCRRSEAKAGADRGVSGMLGVWSTTCPPQPEPSPEEVRAARQELHHLVDLLPDALALALWRLVRAWIAPWHKDEGS